MPNTSRTGSTKLLRAATLATSASVLLAMTTALLPVSGSQAATAQAASKCKLVVIGAHWSIKSHSGRISGSRYTITGRGMPCSSARASVIRFTHQRGTGPGQILRGPSGFNCHSLSGAASGDRLVYEGVCLHPPHNNPYFGWAPKP